jgi:hypothetical protein
MLHNQILFFCRRVNNITKTGINSFSDWTAGDVNTPLPVSLISFNGKTAKGKSELFWNTASEKDNAGFKVLRSEDGQSYQLTDNDFDKSYFYKLVQINQKGFEETSKVIFLDCGCDNRLVISLYPNPTRGEVHFLSNQNFRCRRSFSNGAVGHGW